MFTPKTKSNRRDRGGITIVEVLTSIVVAMIGVFGVLVMIPFAVQQAQSGLDLDDSTNMADDAVATFQIYEFHRINDDGFLPWVDAGDNAGGQINTGFGLNGASSILGNGFHLVHPGIKATNLLDPAVYFDITNPYSYMLNHGPYWLDPLGIEADFATNNIFEEYLGAGGLGTVLNNTNQVLPFRYLSLINKAQDGDGDGVADFIDRDSNDDQVLDIEQDDDSDDIPDPLLLAADFIPSAFARRLFQTENDLQFTLESDQNSLPIPDGGPPQQIFDTQAGLPIRRQARGELSWSMVLVPESSANQVITGKHHPVTSFNTHMLIYKNRTLTNPTLPVADANFDPLLKWTQVDFDFNPQTFQDTPNPLFRGGNIRLVDDGRSLQIPKNGWVMMVNRYSDEMVTEERAEPGFLHQVGFYRVIGTDPVNRTLTMDGPEFDFGEYLNGMDAADGFTRTGTYIVYLKDVVNVFQRTLRWEGASSWNQ